MDNYEEFKKAGKFTLDTDFGELSLKGAATALNLYADEPFELRSPQIFLGCFMIMNRQEIMCH